MRIFYPSFDWREGGAVTRHGEGEGFGAENVTLAAFRGRIRHPRSISRQPLRLAVTRHAEGEGSGAENVTLAVLHGRIRLPCGLLRQPAPRPAARHAEGENLTRRASPSRLSTAHCMPGHRETCRTQDAIPDIRPRIPSGRARPLQPAARAAGTSDTGTSPRLLQQSEATGR